MKKTEGKSVRPTLCESHPDLELELFCSEVDCKGDVFCIQCARQKHRDHEIIPMKSICEAKLGHLKLMKEAIKLNRKKVQSARRKLEDNRIEMRNELARWMDVLYHQLDQLFKRNKDIIEIMISEAHEDLTTWEDDLRRAEDQLEVLKTELSDIIPNIVQTNADKHLDEDLGNLCKTLNNWSIEYNLGKMVGLDPFKNIDKNWVVPLPPKSVKGVSVALCESVLLPVKPEVVTLRTSANKKKRKAEEMNLDLFPMDSDSDEYLKFSRILDVV